MELKKHLRVTFDIFKWCYQLFRNESEEAKNDNSQNEINSARSVIEPQGNVSRYDREELIF